MGAVSNNFADGAVSSLEEIGDAFEACMTEEEITAAIDAAMLEDSLTEMEKLRRDNPTLNDAWEQIKTIRALTNTTVLDDKRPAWERAYYEVLEGAETSNTALREAWNQYYMLKRLLLGNENSNENI
jgi:hypothetical protein